jgi:hypothetical protein
MDSMTDLTQFQTIIFLHLPKTAGTTMRRILEKQYDPGGIYRLDPENWWGSIDEFRELPQSDRCKYRLVMGHMGFGFHQLLPQSSSYFTMLRDPIDRITSIYYFIHRYTSHYLHDTVTSQGMSLVDAVGNRLSREFDNFQTRALSGNVKVPFGECTSEMLETAKNNLRSHFRVVGTTERFDESLVLFRRAFGWRWPFYTKQNVTRNRPKVNELSHQTRQIIAEHNRLDVELHRCAEQMLEKSAREEGTSFRRELHQFRLANYLYNAAYPPARKIAGGSHRLLTRG